MTDTINKMQNLASEIVKSNQALREYAQEHGRAAIGAAFKELLDRHPSVARVSWTQYTPYFNDGDVCRFSVHGLCVVPADNPDDDEDYEFEIYRSAHYNSTPAGLTPEAADEFLALWGKINNNDLMLATFGDHSRVVITREGLEVESYDHD